MAALEIEITGKKATVELVTSGNLTSLGGSGVVTIKDQDDITVTTVTCGTEYSVLRFDGIVDDGGPYSNSVVDPAA